MQHAAVGYCFTRILPRDELQPIPVDAAWVVIDGRIVLSRRLAGGEDAAHLLHPYLTPTEFPLIQSRIDGAYSLCFCMNDGLYVTRDPLGLKPLFLAHEGDLTAVASDRKALWAIGLRNGPIPCRHRMRLRLHPALCVPSRGASSRLAEAHQCLTLRIPPQFRPMLGLASTGPLCNLLYGT